MDLVVSDERNPRAAMSALRSIVDRGASAGVGRGRDDRRGVDRAAAGRDVRDGRRNDGDARRTVEGRRSPRPRHRHRVPRVAARPPGDGTTRHDRTCAIEPDPVAVSTSAGTQYRVTHRTDYSYGATMADGYSVAYLLVRPTPSQRVLSSMLTTTPALDEYDEWPDVFGNRMVQLGVHQPHDDFTVEAVSEVVVYSAGAPAIEPAVGARRRADRRAARAVGARDVCVHGAVPLRDRRRAPGRAAAVGEHSVHAGASDPRTASRRCAP